MSDSLPVPRTVEWPGGPGKARRYAPRRGSGVIGTELPATRGIAIHDAIAHASQPSVRLPSASLRVKLADTRTAVRSDKLGEVAAEFEAVHNVERARQMGSVHSIIPAAELRPRIAAALERGMARTEEGSAYRPVPQTAGGDELRGEEVWGGGTGDGPEPPPRGPGNVPRRD